MRGAILGWQLTSSFSSSLLGTDLSKLFLCSGPWQVMLKQADGSYACVAESAARFTLGQVIQNFACMN